MFGEGCAKELVLDMQTRFPAAFEEVMQENGYANLFRSLESDDLEIRLAAIQAFQVMPSVDDSDMLHYLADHDPDDIVRVAAREAIRTRGSTG